MMLSRFCSLLAITLCLNACAPVPQTSQEFVNAIGQKKARDQHQIIRLSGTYQQAVKRLRLFASHCLTHYPDGYRVQIAGLTLIGDDNSSDNTYVGYFEKRNSSAPRFIIQVQFFPRSVGHIPPGGLYIISADFQSLANHTVRMDLYSGGVGKKLAPSVIAWAKGDMRNCPRLP